MSIPKSKTGNSIYIPSEGKKFDRQSKEASIHLLKDVFDIDVHIPEKDNYRYDLIGTVRDDKFIFNIHPKLVIISDDKVIIRKEYPNVKGEREVEKDNRKEWQYSDNILIVQSEIKRGWDTSGFWNLNPPWKDKENAHIMHVPARKSAWDGTNNYKKPPAESDIHIMFNIKLDTAIITSYDYIFSVKIHYKDTRRLGKLVSEEPFACIPLNWGRDKSRLYYKDKHNRWEEHKIFGKQYIDKLKDWEDYIREGTVLHDQIISNKL